MLLPGNAQLPSSKPAVLPQLRIRPAPVDSNVVPEPWDMPGYADQVIMAAGAFVQGATTELSADAPIHEPYVAYLQGALTYAHGRIAAMLATNAIMNCAK